MPVAPKEVLLTTIRNIAEILQTWEEKRLAASAKYKAEEGKKKGFFSSGPNPEKLNKLISVTGAVSREQTNLKKLNDALTTLTTELSSDNKTAIAQIREIMMMHYIDEYAYGRSRKEGSELLKAIEDVILKATANPADNFFMKNEHLALKSGTGHDHFDSRFLVCQYMNVDPELPNIVAHIFDHIMNASLVNNDKNFEIFTASMKALVRVGLTASASEWNAIVSKHLGSDNNNPFLFKLEEVMNAKVRFNEKGIQASYGYMNATQVAAQQPFVFAKIGEYLRSPAARQDRNLSAAAIKDVSLTPSAEAKSDGATNPAFPSPAGEPPMLLSKYKESREGSTTTPPPEEEGPLSPKI